jgi:hypothetical protein
VTVRETRWTVDTAGKLGLRSLTLVVHTDDPEVVEMVERAARDAAVGITRLSGRCRSSRAPRGR